MPVLADPGFAYAQQNPMDTYRQAADTTLSVMERKQAARQREQAMAMQQQAQDLQREKWNVERPIIQAKLNADILSYGFDLTDRKATEELRAKAATAATELGTKFRDVIQLADWEERNTQLKNLQMEYGWLGKFGQFAPVIKAVDDSRAEAVSNILAEKKLEYAQFQYDERFRMLEFREAQANERAREAEQTKRDLQAARDEIEKLKLAATEREKALWREHDSKEGALDRESREKRPSTIFNFGSAPVVQPAPQTKPAGQAVTGLPTQEPTRTNTPEVAKPSLF
jgi:1,4-alpha-glucan branching enzyme